MARSFLSIAMQAARAAERAQREQLRQQEHQARQATRTLRERDRLDKRSYQEARAAEVDEMNRSLAATVGALETLLADALARPFGMDWSALERKVSEADLGEKPPAPPNRDTFRPKPPGMFQKLVPGWRKRFNRKVAEAAAAFKSEFERYSTVVRARREKLVKLQEEAHKHNRKITRFRESYRSGKPEAVATFFASIFEASDQPAKFPRKWQLRYAPESRHLVINFDLPIIDDIVPLVERYKYSKSSDEISEFKKTQKARQNIYSVVVPQLVLKRLYEIFTSDLEKVVDVVTVSAFVEAIDPSTGQRVRPCLVSVRTTRDEFEKLDLRHVDPVACLKRLNATVSRSPSELVAVKPIIELNMVDPRFIQESDVLSDLDSRPNLMELTPGEFENLITNLFQRMGLETKLTQASRDGGVDCVAFDPRPVLGGKVVVQAKRYKNTVGVSAVRDLFGTMHNEGASKGILVTTSGYGKAAYEFANGKPIELLDGSNLIYLLKEHAGIDAKIVIPSDWRDFDHFEFKNIQSVSVRLWQMSPWP